MAAQLSTRGEEFSPEIEEKGIDRYLFQHVLSLLPILFEPPPKSL